jgi:hypothetical protein
MSKQVVLFEAEDYREAPHTQQVRTKSFAGYLRECEALKLAVDMEISAGSNRLRLIELLRQAGELSNKGIRRFFLFWGEDKTCHFKTLADLLAMGAQLRTEGFIVLVNKRYNGIYLDVRW